MADNFEIIKCPACQKEMKKVFISAKGINVDVCTDGCGGIYFDNREFKHFDEQHENIDEILNVLKDKTFDKTDETKVRVCPYCSTNMVKNYSSINKQVQIDECYTCGGKFLDNGELEKIRGEYLNEEARSADFTNKLLKMIENEVK